MEPTYVHYVRATYGNPQSAGLAAGRFLKVKTGVLECTTGDSTRDDLIPDRIDSMLLDVVPDSSQVGLPHRLQYAAKFLGAKEAMAKLHDEHLRTNRLHGTRHGHARENDAMGYRGPSPPAEACQNGSLGRLSPHGHAPTYGLHRRRPQDQDQCLQATAGCPAIQPNCKAQTAHARMARCTQTSTQVTLVWGHAGILPSGPVPPRLLGGLC